MATQSLLYSAVTAFTLTGASLGANAAREGTIVANSSNYIDMMISGSITLGAAASNGNAYVVLSSSDGTTISEPATGTDGALALPGVAFAALEGLRYGDVVPGTELVFLLKLECRGKAAGVVQKFPVISVANAFGGQIPIGGWAPVLINMTGQSLSASATLFDYTGVRYTIT